MSEVFRKYRSRRIVEAKQVDHSFGLYNPRTGQTQPAQPGDYLVKEPGQPQVIVPQETFRREYEAVE